MGIYGCVFCGVWVGVAAVVPSQSTQIYTQRQGRYRYNIHIYKNIRCLACLPAPVAAARPAPPTPRTPPIAPPVQTFYWIDLIVVDQCVCVGLNTRGCLGDGWEREGSVRRHRAYDTYI